MDRKAEGVRQHPHRDGSGHGRHQVDPAAAVSGQHGFRHAARLSVSIADGMVRAGLVDDRHGVALTPAGRSWLAELGIGVDALSSPARPVIRTCLDWTERRSHLAGVVGARLHERFADDGWIKRVGCGRAVRLTPSGAAALRELLDVDLQPH